MHVTRRLLIGIVVTLALALSACADDAGETTADETAADDTETAATEDDTETAATEDDTADGDPSEETQDSEPAAGDGDDEAMSGATVGVASSGLGDIVVDDEGRTLYMFVPDEGGEPTCTDACAETWPVFEGPATAGEDVDESLLSTAAHPSGATQVAYGGWPLYYFASDAAPGDTNGQGINDVWFVIGPDGEPIRDAAAAS